jgi:hypothetical protein
VWTSYCNLPQTTTLELSRSADVWLGGPNTKKQTTAVICAVICLVFEVAQVEDRGGQGECGSMHAVCFLTIYTHPDLHLYLAYLLHCFCDGHASLLRRLCCLAEALRHRLRLPPVPIGSSPRRHRPVVTVISPWLQRVKPSAGGAWGIYLLPPKRFPRLFLASRLDAAEGQIDLRARHPYPPTCLQPILLSPLGTRGSFHKSSQLRPPSTHMCAAVVSMPQVPPPLEAGAQADARPLEQQERWSWWLHCVAMQMRATQLP